jgi:hypothetical protein
MKFFVRPDEIDALKKRFALMTKHLVKKPIINISEPRQEVYHTLTISRPDCSGPANFEHSHFMIDVAEVTIDNLEVNNWAMVATAFHQDKVVTKLSDEYYKLMPSYLGLSYARCDCCGKTHASRKESHILYNSEENRWMQVGTSCVDKMLPGGKYLASFMIELYHVLDMTGNCGGGDEDGFSSWCKRQPDTAFMACASVDEIIPAVVEYRKTNPEWRKTVYDDDGHKYPGSTSDIIGVFKRGPYQIDKAYIDAVKNYVSEMESASDFIEDIKKAFEAEFINMYEVAKVFFAVKMYEDQPKKEAFSDTLNKHKIAKGEKYEVCGSIVDQKVIYDPYARFSSTYCETYIQDEASGLTFVTTSSTVENYAVGDGKYRFAAKVSGYSANKCAVYLKGRLSKIAKAQYVEPTNND